MVVLSASRSYTLADNAAELNSSLMECLRLRAGERLAISLAGSGWERRLRTSFFFLLGEGTYELSFKRGLSSSEESVGRCRLRSRSYGS